MPRIKVSDYIALNKVSLVVFELTGVIQATSTIYHWARRGKIGHNGHRAKLQTSKRMRRCYTTRQWIIDFVGKM